MFITLTPVNSFATLQKWGGRVIPRTCGSEVVQVLGLAYGRVANRDAPLSFGAALALAKRSPWKQYKTFVDAGCAQGESRSKSPLASSSHWRGYGPAGCATDL